MLRPELLPHLVPEVGVDGRPALHLLRRAGDVDRRGHQLLVPVPEEQHLDAVVLVPLDPPECGLVRRAVHLGVAVGVDRAAVLRHHRMPEPPADEPRLAALPGSRGDPGDAFDQERAILGRLHHPFAGDLVEPVLHVGCRMRVRGVEDELPRVEPGNPFLEPPADRLEDPVADRHQVARDQDGLVDHLVALPRLERQGRRRHRAFHLPGDSRVHLPRERDRSIGRDADRRPADV